MAGDKKLDWGIFSGAIGPRARLLSVRLGARSIAALSGEDLPTGSHTVLALVAANPGSSQSALANAAGITKSALVGIVDRLEAEGLAARDRSSSDRRRNRIILTAKGEERMEAMFALVDPGEAELREALGPEDAALLAQLLDRACAALE